MKATLAFFALVLLGPAALAADAPEAVYRKFHRAIIANDMEEMLRYGSDAQRADVAKMSPAEKAASLKMLSALMPRAYAVKWQAPDAGGQSTRLALTGQAPQLIGDKQETMFGDIRLVLERGEWKVSKAYWSNTDPGPAPASARNVPKPAAPAAAAKPSPPVKQTPVVGSLNSAPDRKLGTQKAPCVYKPVMTAEDLENCK